MSKLPSPFPPKGRDLVIDHHGYQPTPTTIAPSGVSKPQGGYVPTGSGVPQPPTTGSGVKPPASK